MPARVTVYCTASAAGLSPSAMREELDLADLYTLAECLELPEGEWAAVNAMKPHLRVVGDEGSFGTFLVHWRPEGRPIRIDRRFGEGARGEIEETLAEALPDDPSPGARRVRRHLRACSEIVHFELGIPDSLHLAATLTEVLAFFVAERCDGLVWFYGREWAAPDDRGRTLWRTG